MHHGSGQVIGSPEGTQPSWAPWGIGFLRPGGRRMGITRLQDLSPQELHFGDLVGVLRGDGLVGDKPGGFPQAVQGCISRGQGRSTLLSRGQWRQRWAPAGLVALPSSSPNVR